MNSGNCLKTMGYGSKTRHELKSGNCLKTRICSGNATWLQTTSAEDFTSPSNRDKLLKITKEKGIQDIMANTTVNTFTNKTSVVCLYRENLPELGENYYCSVYQNLQTTRNCGRNEQIYPGTNWQWELLCWDPLLRGREEVSSSTFCGLQLLSVQHQHLHQGENDNGYWIRPQPKWHYPTCTWRCP